MLRTEKKDNIQQRWLQCNFKLQMSGGLNVRLVRIVLGVECLWYGSVCDGMIQNATGEMQEMSLYLS